MTRTRLLDNLSGRVGDEILNCMALATRTIMAVAFVKFSGVRLIEERRTYCPWGVVSKALFPLLTHIEATDRFIDRIVYKLYGLTEEVAVVEGG